MRFNWINEVNAAAVLWLLLVNLLAARKGLSARFSSKHRLVNFLEQVGRCGCMALMVLPAFKTGWAFCFGSTVEMFVWLGATVLLLTLYSALWTKKAGGGAAVLYGLALIPAALFLLNGGLLHHPALIVAALAFGCAHIGIVKENI